MTTIATDGKSMAADGLCTGNGIVYDLAIRKIHRLKDGRIVGMCGSVYHQAPFLEWLANGGEKPTMNDNFEALVLSPDGTLRSYDEHCRAIELSIPNVAGSGGALALGAMLAGASPERAVSIAAERDTASGGAIAVLHIDSNDDA